jgi:hypothetical protein
MRRASHLDLVYLIYWIRVSTCWYIHDSPSITRYEFEGTDHLEQYLSLSQVHFCQSRLRELVCPLVELTVNARIDSIVHILRDILVNFFVNGLVDEAVSSVASLVTLTTLVVVVVVVVVVIVVSVLV